MQARSDIPGEAEQAFAPVPAWERSAKRNKSLFGGRKPTRAAAPAPVAEEPRSFAPPEPEPAYTPRTVTAIDEAPAPRVSRHPSTMEDTRGMAGGDAFVAAPVYADRSRKTSTARKGGVSGIAIAAGVAAVGVIAAGAWYASQPRTSGVETLAPSAPVQTAAAPASAMTPAAPMETAAAASPTIAPADQPAAAPARVARARPAPSPAASADDMGVNASATMPAAPMPYAEIPQLATGGTVAPAPVPASTAAMLAAAAPAPVVPAPVTAAPATTVPAAPASAPAAQPTPVNPAPEAAAQPGADVTTNPTP